MQQEAEASYRCGIAATTKYIYASRLRVGLTSDMVDATTEAASPSREGQSLHRPCEKIFRYTYR